MSSKSNSAAMHFAPKQKSDPIVVTHPELAMQWHTSLNGALRPHVVTHSSWIKIYWQCPKTKEHVWREAVRTRVYSIRPADCPLCTGRRPSENNSLAVLDPKLAALWHSTKNRDLTPSIIKSTSKKSVWWQCAVNDKHEWKAAIVDAYKSKAFRCPVCHPSKKPGARNSQAIGKEAKSQCLFPDKEHKCFAFNLTGVGLKLLKDQADAKGVSYSDFIEILIRSRVNNPVPKLAMSLLKRGPNSGTRSYFYDKNGKSTTTICLTGEGRRMICDQVMEAGMSRGEYIEYILRQPAGMIPEEFAAVHNGFAFEPEREILVDLEPPVISLKQTIERLRSVGAWGLFLKRIMEVEELCNKPEYSSQEDLVHALLLAYVKDREMKSVCTDAQMAVALLMDSPNSIIHKSVFDFNISPNLRIVMRKNGILKVKDLLVRDFAVLCSLPRMQTATLVELFSFLNSILGLYK